MTAEIRKHQHTLVIVGYAVILFGIWDIVKAALHFTVNDQLLRSLEAESEAAGLDPDMKAMSYVLTVILLVLGAAVTLWVHFYVGHIAVRLGRGERRKCGGMVFWTVILILFAAAGAPLSIYGIAQGEDILNMTGTLLMDLTSAVTMIGMLTALRRIRKLTRQYGGGDAA